MKKTTALVLLMASSLTVLAGAVIAPALPGLRQSFSTVGNVDLLSRMVITVPALGVILGAPLIGRLIDRQGRRRALVGGLVVYGLGGCSGLWFGSLPWILAGRLVLGVGVAAVMTASTALIADMTTGTSRSHWLGMQAAFIGGGGLAFLTLGGWLADFSWRWPFAVYAVSFLLVPLTLMAVNPDSGHGARTRDSGLLPRQAWLIYLAAFLSMVIFFLGPVQLPFLMDQNLEASPRSIGLALGMMNVAISCGSLSFSRLQRRLGSRRLLMFTFLMMSPGLALIGWLPTLVGAIGGIMLFGLAVGWLMPNLNLMTSNLVTEAQRGTALGNMNTGLFMGQFASPILIVPMLRAGLSLNQVFLWGAAFSCLVALCAFLICGRGSHPMCPASSSEAK
jgi:MFS family permease